VIGFGLALIGILNGFYGIGFWIPQIVQAMGLSTRMTGLVAAIPYLTAAIAMLIWARLPTLLTATASPLRAACNRISSFSWRSPVPKSANTDW
jgi:cyanate permease